MRNAIVLVLGRKGSGKSHWVKYEALPRLRQTQPVVIIDTVYEYAQFGEVFTDADVLFDACYGDGGPRVAVLQSGVEEAEAMLEYCYQLQPHTVIVEEAHRYCSPWYLSDGFDSLVREGRHRQISLVAVTQNFSDLPERFVSQADALVCFQQRGVNSLRRLDKFIAEDGRPASAVVRELPLYTSTFIEL